MYEFIARNSESIGWIIIILSCAAATAFPKGPNDVNP